MSGINKETMDRIVKLTKQSLNMYLDNKYSQDDFNEIYNEIDELSSDYDNNEDFANDFFDEITGHFRETFKKAEKMSKIVDGKVVKDHNRIIQPYVVLNGCEDLFPMACINYPRLEFTMWVYENTKLTSFNVLSEIGICCRRKGLIKPGEELFNKYFIWDEVKTPDDLELLFKAGIYIDFCGKTAHNVSDLKTYLHAVYLGMSFYPPDWDSYYCVLDNEIGYMLLTAEWQISEPAKKRKKVEYAINHHLEDFESFAKRFPDWKNYVTESLLFDTFKRSINNKSFMIDIFKKYELFEHISNDYIIHLLKFKNYSYILDYEIDAMKILLDEKWDDDSFRNNLPGLEDIHHIFLDILICKGYTTINWSDKYFNVYGNFDSSYSIYLEERFTTYIKHGIEPPKELQGYCKHEWNSALEEIKKNKVHRKSARSVF